MLSPALFVFLLLAIFLALVVAVGALVVSAIAVKGRTAVHLTRYGSNPIISPKREHDWESEGTFNAGAVLIDGIVHFLYRAIGRDGSSSFGYALSKNGYNIHERHGTPAYVARKWFEGVHQEPRGFSPYFSSGGGWGGCEDPKLTRIGDMIYLTYVAMPGYWPTHTAISSISVDDFLNARWDKWSHPALMSPPGLDSKSASLLSEKINGQYVIFHRSWPDIIVEYADDLDFHRDDRWLQPLPAIPLWRRDGGRCVIQHGKWPNIIEEETSYTDDHLLREGERWKELVRGQRRISVRRDKWDSHKISLAAPPVKTSYGWLAIYGAVDRRDYGNYKVGAMLLDLQTPERVLYRTNSPILAPLEWYESDWKPGVVYPSGLVLKDGTLFMYYGGGDKHTAVATAPIDVFLHEFIEEGRVRSKIFSW